MLYTTTYTNIPPIWFHLFFFFIFLFVVPLYTILLLLGELQWMDTSLNCPSLLLRASDWIFFFGLNNMLMILQHGFTEIYPTEEKRTMPMGGYSCDIRTDNFWYSVAHRGEGGDGGYWRRQVKDQWATSINLAEPRFLPCSCQGRENQNFPITHR